MSTATPGRPAVADNEFPVLLRLPDLNAPVWTPLPTGLSALATSSAVTTSPAISALAPVPVTPVSTPPAALPVQTPTLMSSTSVEVIATTPATSSAAKTTTTSTSTTTTTTTGTPIPRSPRMPRTERVVATVGKWTLIRQIATGGVLVGGLALTYFVVMGGSSHDEAGHDHAAAPTKPAEPAVNVVETRVVQKTPTPSPRLEDIGPVPGPPEFSLDTTKTDDGSARLADTGRMNPSLPSPVDPRVVAEKPAPTLEPPANPRPNYPTTDPQMYPSAYLQRPASVGEPTSPTARTARLEGNIAPAPVR
jgi:hypothetical protein